MRIYVDPACDILYSSYYLFGFKELEFEVIFTSKYFDLFELNNQFLPIVVEKNNQFFRVIIDYGDGANIDQIAYGWSDRYFKINCKYGDLSEFGKLICIGPSFGINIYTKHQLFILGISNFIKARKRIHNVKRFFSNYKALLGRLSYNYYTIKKPRTNYIYFMASIWKNEKETNNFRLNFIKACQAIKGVDFEGGFAPRSNGDNLGYDNFVTNSRISLKEYVNKIKDSEVVFNTPAVLHCHGWKLAEFLALGKVIISTPISRALPEDLVDKKNLLVTDGTQYDIELKIKEIISNPVLSDELSFQARKYFDTYLSPKSVCQIIVDSVNK